MGRFARHSPHAASLHPGWQGGRGVQLLTGTQEPHRVNSSIVGQAAELVCFRLQEPKAWNCIRDLGADPDLVGALPLGSFVSYNRLSGGKLAGNCFRGQPAPSLE